MARKRGIATKTLRSYIQGITVVTRKNSIETKEAGDRIRAWAQI